MNKLIIPITFFILFLFFSCTTPKDKFAKGDYKGAYNAALKNLKNEKKATDLDRDILIKSLDKIYLAERKEVAFYEHSKDLLEVEKAFKSNQKLIEKIEKAIPYLDGKFEFNYQQSIDKENELKDVLVDEYLFLGEERLSASIDSGNKFLAQKAFNNFKKADKYGANNSNLDSLYQLCYDYGTLVYRVSTEAPFDLLYNWEIDRVFDNIDSYGNNFKRIVYESNASNIDCDIEIRFSNLQIQTSDNNNSQTFRESVVDKYETVTDTSGFTSQQEIRINVEGTVTTVQTTKIAEWQAEVYIRSHSNNCRLSSSTFIANTESRISEYELSGDERAIPQTYKTTSFEQLETDKDMAKELMEEIYQQFLNEYF